MLQLILGRPGSGKTYEIFERLTAAATNVSCADGCLLLVPEQFSFESERRLLQRLGAKAASNVKVYSFTRLAEMILRETGHFAGHRMNEAARTMLVSRALSQTASALKIPRRATDSGQVAAVSRMLAELKQGTVTAEDLRQQAMEETGLLQDKLNDLALISEAYEALVQQAYVDPGEALTVAADRLSECDFARGAHLFVDGFTGFTEQEKRLLCRLMERTAQTTVALCTDSLQDESKGFDLFSIPTETANGLIRLAKESGISVSPPIWLQEDYRHQTEGLRALQASLYSVSDKAVTEAVTDVKVITCSDIYDECDRVTRTVHRFLREGGRARDVAVVARNLSGYRGVLDVALRQAGIPCFMDEDKTILYDALTGTLLSAIRVVSDGWQTEDLLRLMKAGLLGFSSHSISLIEEYAEVWNLSGSRFRQKWSKHPDGFSSDTKAVASRLDYLNLLRSRLVKPLETLQKALDHPVAAREFAMALYRYLKAARVDRMTRLQVRRLQAAGEPALAERTERLWNMMMELLDTFGVAGEETPRSAKEHRELFRMVAETTEIGSIPPGLDAVQIGAADRVRLSQPKWVFVLGANEGVFPGVPSGGGYLTDRERRQLLEREMPLAGGTDWQANQERWFAYAAVTAPSEKLFVSYETGNLQGDTKQPSSLVYAIRSVLSSVPEETTGDGMNIETPGEALHRLAADYRHPTVLTASLSAALSEQPLYADKVKALDRESDGTKWDITDSAVAHRLFGDEMNLSYSAVDSYYTCPFRYFCYYGLRVRAVQSAELNSLTFGKVVHDLLQHALPEYQRQGIATVTEEQTQQDAERLVDRYVQEKMGGTAELPARFFYLLSRLKNEAKSLLWAVVQEQQQSEFHPADYELSFGTGSDAVPPLTLTLADGATVQISGQIDRVDTYHKDGKTYFRVIDYKTGNEEFSLDEVVEGINLQLLIYLFTLSENGGKRYDNPAPAGLLYWPLQRKEKSKSLMNGLLTDDVEVLHVMEETPGIYIPKEGKKWSFATAEQFDRLRERMETLLKEMGQALRDGHIERKPFEPKNPCKYCDYGEVCGYEPGDPTRQPVKGRKEQVMEPENAE